MATNGHSWSHPAGLIVAAVLVALGVFGAACKGGDNDEVGPGPTVVRAEESGEPRSFKLGFGALPPSQTTEAYVNTFATAAQYAEIINIRRTPPWEEFLPGATPSDETIELTQLETALMRQYEPLELLFTIDVTDAGVKRARIADMPAGYDPADGFFNLDIRQAFVAYATYIARNYQPEYLALGAEVNMHRHRAPAQFEAFTTLYAEAYDSVKAASPDTKVFPTFQLEDLLGLLDDIHEPQWEALEPFRGRMDVFAVTTYPYLTEIPSATSLPLNYYSQLNEHYIGEIVIAEAGYASDPVEGRPVVGSETDQLQFLSFLVQNMDERGFDALIWFAALDPQFAAEGPDAVLKDAALRRGDGANKEAWTIWEEQARRPLNLPDDGE